MATSKRQRPRLSRAALTRGSFARKLLILVMAMLVAALVAFGVWVTVSAIVQKGKVSRGAEQIYDIVELSRRIATNDRTLGANPRDDLLGRLAAAGQIQTQNNTGQGLRFLTNPWEGTMVAYTMSGFQFKIETVLPSRACVRIIELMGQNVNSLGLKQVDVKGVDESWRQIYSDKTRNNLGSEEIAAGCRSDQMVMLDLTFTLR